MKLLLDTFSLTYRAFYALPAMHTSAGTPSAALYGLSVLLLKVLREHQPTDIAFALDRGPSFRRAADPSYKANRARTPDELSSQLSALPALFSALGTPAHSAEGFEADDVIATLSRRWSADGERVLVVSGDRDLFQVVDPRVRVLFVGRRGQDHVMYDEHQVQRRYGLSPGQLPSFIALVGDKSDNLPKVPGVGDKTASRWLASHGDLDGVLAHIDGLEPKRLRATLEDHAEQARRCRVLATLRTDVPVADDPDAAPLTSTAIDGLRHWFERWEFASLVDRLGGLPQAAPER